MDGLLAPPGIAPARTTLTLQRIHDGPTWNRLVRMLPRHDVRQGFEWSELRAEEGWRPTRLAVLADDRCVGACALESFRLPGVGAILSAPRGPLVDPAAPAALPILLGGIAKAARAVGGICVRISPRPEIAEPPMALQLAEHGWVPLPETWTMWNVARHSQVLDLRPPEAELWRRVRRRQREYVTAGERSGLRVEASDREDDLVPFHRLVADVARRKRFPAHDLAYFQAVRRQYRARDGYTLLVAREEGRVVGGLLAIRLGAFTAMLATAAEQDTDRRRHAVSPALYWAYIRHAKAEGCDTADFGPSGVGLVPQELDAGWGVYRFKASFGCEFVTFPPFYDLVLRPTRYRLFRYCETQLLPYLWSKNGRRLAAILARLARR